MDIIVSIILNAVLVLVALGCCFNGVRDGIRFSIAKLICTLGVGVGAYFLVPVIADKICAIAIVDAFLAELGVSAATINACLFFVVFLLAFILVYSVFAIIKHCVIYKKRKTVNSAKKRKVRGVNKSKERSIAKAEKKEQLAQYRASFKVHHKLLGALINVLTAVVFCGAIMLPTHFIFEDIVAKHADKAFLNKGFEWTAYGWLDSEIEWMDFVVRAEDEEKEEEICEDPVEEETPVEEEQEEISDVIEENPADEIIEEEIEHEQEEEQEHEEAEEQEEEGLTE